MSEIINDPNKAIEMTYKEAAEIIKTMHIGFARRNGKMRMCMALNKAIEALETLDKKPDILFLCDRCIDKCGNACLEPNYVCSHTTDISHAKNFAHVVDDNGNIDCYVESLLDTYPEVQDVNN